MEMGTLPNCLRLLMIKEGLLRMGVVSLRSLIEKAEIVASYDNVIELKVTLKMGIIDEDGKPSSEWGEDFRKTLENATYSLLVI